MHCSFNAIAELHIDFNRMQISLKIDFRIARLKFMYMQVDGDWFFPQILFDMQVLKIN